ncbi:MBL fold metallo-hydrolase [bacterium]|nr:MBL fold metallo-hydrolase [bacterium]
MKLILLGTGGPKPDPNRQGPCLAIQIADQVILFDAGRGAGTQLARAGIPVETVNPICITHHHYDHIGNLGDIILSSWNLGRKDPLLIFGPDGTAGMVNVLLGQVYNKDINFRMIEAGSSGVALTDIGTLVRAEDVQPGTVYENDRVKIVCDYVRHGHGLGISPKIWQCLGYRIEAEGKTVAVSGDSVDCQGLDALARDSDALVLSCYLSAGEMADREGKLISEHILTGSLQAGEIARKVNTGKLILTHIREKSDALLEEMAGEIRIGYGGDIIVGRDLLVIEV